MSKTNPAITTTVARRALGAHLSELRKRTRISIKAMARDLVMAESSIYRIENGETAIRPATVREICRICNAPKEVMEALAAMARDTDADGWWVRC